MVENEDTISLPSPYCITRLTHPGGCQSFSSEVEETGCSPVWAAAHLFRLPTTQESCAVSSLEFTMWSFNASNNHDFLGRTSLNISSLPLGPARTLWLPLRPENNHTPEHRRESRTLPSFSPNPNQELCPRRGWVERRSSDWSCSLRPHPSINNRRSSDGVAGRRQSEINHQGLVRHNSLENRPTAVSGPMVRKPKSSDSSSSELDNSGSGGLQGL